MELLAIETGTKEGYEDYHGEVFADSHLKVGNWHYDKDQRIYIGMILSDFVVHKRFYAPSVSMMIKKMETWLDKNQIQFVKK